jgi:hypothetical protein
MNYVKLPILDESGYAIVDSYDQSADPREWENLVYVDWKSSGDTRFAPLASAYGDMECDGFWNHTPAKTDKDGVWVQENIDIAPRLTDRAQEVGANVGRCRVIELQPNTYADAIYNLHRDDNNRLNPEGTGWIVRSFYNLTDNPDSVMILREDRDDPSTEVRVPLPAGTQVVIDTQRLYHAVWHPGDEPRYCLITSYESGPELESWIDSRNPITTIESPYLDPAVIEAGNTDAIRRRAEREAAKSGSTDAGSTDAGSMGMEVLSEA